MLLLCVLLVQYKASKEGTVMGVAVSKVAMLTHCQALTQACNYCEGECRYHPLFASPVFINHVTSEDMYVFLHLKVKL